MKTNRSLSPAHRSTALSLLCFAIASTLTAQNETRKAANTTALNNAASWINGLPDIDTLAVWDSTVTGPNTSNMGGSWSALGLFIDNPGGPISIHGTATSQILTLGAEGITVNGADLSFTNSGTINLLADQTWSIAAGRTLSFNHGWAAMTGNAALEITGPGNLILGQSDGARTYSFGTGELTLGGGLRLINDATDLHTRSRTVTNRVSLNGNIILQSNANGVAGNGANAFKFTGGLDTGTADRTITLSLPNLPESLSSVSISRTVLDFDFANALTGTGTVYFRNESLDADKAAHVRVLNVANAIAVGGLNIGANVYFTLQGASADIGAATAVTVESGGFLALGSAVSTSGGTRTIKSLAGAGTVLSLATNTNSSTLVINGGTGTGRTEFSGTIQNGPTSGVIVALTKAGATTQILSGTNTYSGATAIDGGTLLVNGTHIQTGVGNFYTVNSGGTLGGTGLIALSRPSGNNSMITVNSGGVLAPGDDDTLGTLTLDGQYLTGTGTNVHLRMQAGAEFHVDLAGDGSGADGIDFWNFNIGDLVLADNVVNFSLVGPQVAGTYDVDLLRFFSDSGNTLTTSGIVGTAAATRLVLGSLEGTGIDSATIHYDSAGGRVWLEYTVAPIPEPSTWAAILGGLVLSVSVVRRPRRP